MMPRKPNESSARVRMGGRGLSNEKVAVENVLANGARFRKLKGRSYPHKIGCKSRRNSGIKQLERASNGELRRSLKQAAGIRVNRSVRDQVSAANFYNFSLIHHRDARRKIAHHWH